jgi:X-Pro dipeptidyl-peptidase
VRPGRLCAATIALATALVGLAPGGAAAQQQPPPAQSYETAEGKSQPKYDDFVVEEYRVPTKWGTLYGVVERPVVPKGVKVPIILTYTPYSALGGVTPLTTDRLRDPVSAYFVPRGYARAIFDLVGTNGSSGCYDYGGIRERESGAELVDHLGKLKWSNGRVGMIGGSYDGTTQWAAAVETPKHLTTIVPQVAIGRWYDYAYGQGVRFYSGYGTPALFDFGLGFVPPTHSSPPDPEAVRDHGNPCERVEHNQRGFLPDPVYDEFWDERDYLARIHKVRASVMIEGSWIDYNVHPINSYEMWEALPAGHPKRFVMAQQGHDSANFPDSVNVRHAWFDYWLLGLDTGVMDLPQVDSMTNLKTRFQSEQWPPRGTRNVRIPLRDKQAKGAFGLLEGNDAVWVDNNPTLAGRDAAAGDGGEAATLFVGEKLKRAVRIAGQPLLDLKVTTSTENTWVTPVLYEQKQDGSVDDITLGLLNARNRFGLRKSVPVVPNEPWTGTVRFQPTDYVVAAGSRIGVALMSMNTDEALYWGASGATNELKLDGSSRLIIPFAPTATP